MTIFVIAIGVFDLVFKLAVKFPPDDIRHIQGVESVIKSPLFLLAYNVFLAAVSLAILLTRTKTRYYPVRVIAYGMVLAGLIGQLLVALVPWRT